MKALVFPGQGSQFVGMGKELYDTNPLAKELFDKADDILGYKITSIMFEGTADELKQTKVTQPAVFLHSVISALCAENETPEMVAGHSLGEFSALVVAGAISFEDGLKLVYKRAMAMQDCCEKHPGSMAAIVKLDDDQIEKECILLSADGEGLVVPANYNSPGQLVISGNQEKVAVACDRFLAMGAKRALVLPVSGAFHSPLMMEAQKSLQEAIEATEFSTPKCPVYQNVDAKAHTDAAEIKSNLIAQLTGSVRWKYEVEQMIADGATEFVECGPGKALQGMIAKIAAGNEAVSVRGL